MAKVITDVWGFAHAIQRQFGCDREILEQLVERFSEDRVLTGDRFEIATTILRIAREENGVDDEEEWGSASSILEDPDIDFDEIFRHYSNTDWVEVGFSYESLKEAVLRVYTPAQCEEFVQRSL